MWRVMTEMHRSPGKEATRSLPPPAVSVVLVDALQVVRAGLSLLIAAEPDMGVLGEAGTADSAMSILKKLRSRSGALALVGLNLSGDHDSFWLIRAVRDTYPSMPILACGASADAITISRCLFYGADGFLDKSGPPKAFLDGLRRAANGEVVLEGVAPGSVREVAQGVERHRASASLLTQRERQVLTAAAEGLTARQIGSRLGVRERTVTTHLAHIYKKLGAAGRVGALATASRSGLVSLNGSD
jgi:DNA-binding NarL/FixJ family response regulator